MQYYELPGTVNATAFNNRVLVGMGNVRPAQYPVVDIVADAFHLVEVNGLRIPNEAKMSDGLDRGPQARKHFETLRGE